MLKVLLVHNFYQQSGGEDIVFAAESNLLREKGHDVIEFIEHNDRIRTMGKIDVALQTFWSHPSYRKVTEILVNEKPDIVHFHNTFPLISPAAYYACYEKGIAVVQTLHNYRLLCPEATFYRNGNVCEECLGKAIALPGLQHGCYHKSQVQTAVVAGMLAMHRVLGTWEDKVNIYITLTEFGKQKFVQGGLKKEMIVVKPNFVQENPGIGERDGNFALYAGRFSPEKGIRTLIEAWKLCGNIPIKIVGDGPLLSSVEQYASYNPSFSLIGKLTHKELLKLIKMAFFIIVPSECYEAFSLVIIEAFACGLPVIAANIGALKEIVTDNVTGLFFNTGDSADLAAKICWACEHPVEMTQMGINARNEYEKKFTAEKNYGMLISIYERAISENRTAK
jgi:glycosyltransferase involved in cell wall biosynthesis